MATEDGLLRWRAVAFIVLLGAISLTGLVSGFGELVGYAVRVGSGYLAHRSVRRWARLSA